MRVRMMAIVPNIGAMTSIVMLHLTFIRSDGFIAAPALISTATLHYSRSRSRSICGACDCVSIFGDCHLCMSAVGDERRKRRSSMKCVDPQRRIQLPSRRKMTRLLRMTGTGNNKYDSKQCEEEVIRNSTKLLSFLQRYFCSLSFNPRIARTVAMVFAVLMTTTIAGTAQATATSTNCPQLLQHTITGGGSGFLGMSTNNANSIQYYLVRSIYLRGLGLLYIFAFLIALHQNKGLIGNNGITPASHILAKAEQRAVTKSKQRRLWQQQRQHSIERQLEQQHSSPILSRAALARIQISKLFYEYVANPFHRYFWDRCDARGRPLPSLLWIFIAFKNNIFANNFKIKKHSATTTTSATAVPSTRLNTNDGIGNKFMSSHNMMINDAWLDYIALYGLFLSCILVTKGAANVFIIFMLWLCQRSLMSVGGPWYGYGWETQLAELTFHTLFMVPLTSLNPYPILTPVPIIVVWSMRWFIFRIMIGAGLIKIRSRNDDKWRNFTAMNYFYETMVELVVPWFLILPFLPRSWRIHAAITQLIFQSILIISGNLSFLNWLTMLPSLFCLDDAFLCVLFSPLRMSSSSIASYTHLASFWGTSRNVRKAVNIFFGALIFKLSIPVGRNLLSKKQVMNTSFDPLRLVNTYGAFGSVNEERIELIVKATDDLDNPWREYSFKVKPGDVMRHPRWVSPYHYRLDWQMWIASSAGTIERSSWMYRFLLKLLKEEDVVLSLLERNPWNTKVDHVGSALSSRDDRNAKAKPRYLIVERYRYRFANGSINPDSDNQSASSKPYWVRKKVGRYFPRQGVATEALLEELVNRSM